MKTKAVLIFGMILLSLGIYWYRSSAAVCPVPLSYRIGTIDQDFSITEEEALSRIAEAEHLWETAMQRELFVYDDDADFLINFVFDERQATADAEYTERLQLDVEQSENEKLFEDIASLQGEYAKLVARYESKEQVYRSRLAEYNQEVLQYNDRGGAPSDIYARLETERRSLDREATALRLLSNEINQVANEINRLGEEGNRKVVEYNRAVERYNSKYGYGREFTQGDYQGREINIYKFSDDAELVSVLAHEFGHALGIGHVEGNASVMYYLLEQSGDGPMLSETDKEAFMEVCGDVETWDQKLRRIIREFLTKIN